MRMNHLDLYVPDVQATTAFLTRYFGLTLIAMRGEGGLAILNDESGMEIVISHPIEKLGGVDQATLGRDTYHIGFMLPERGDVDRLWQALHDGGAELAGKPKAMRGGWLFYCTAPGRVLIEVGWRP